MSQQMVIIGSAALFSSMIIIVIISVVIYYQYFQETKKDKTPTTSAPVTTTSAPVTTTAAPVTTTAAPVTTTAAPLSITKSPITSTPVTKITKKPVTTASPVTKIIPSSLFTKKPVTATASSVATVDPLVKCKVEHASKIRTGDIVFINSSDKKCYKCTAGRYTREDLEATNTKACKGTEGAIKEYAISEKKLLPSEGVALDSNIVFACPENTSRNLEAISSETPCSGQCSSLYGSESFEHMSSGVCYTCEGGSRNANLAGSGKECYRSCESGYLPDPNGKCYKCKDGSSRTLYAVDDPKACSTGIFNGDILSPAIFGKDWLYSWRSDGKTSRPLKLKENIYSKATLLG